MNIIINRINMYIVTSLKEIKNVCSSLGTQRCSDYSNSYSRLPALGLNFLKFLNQNFRKKTVNGFMDYDRTYNYIRIINIMFTDADAPKAFKEEGGLGILGPAITVMYQ